MDSIVGTFVNGQKVVSQEIRLGDALKFGDKEFLIRPRVVKAGHDLSLPPILNQASSPLATSRTQSPPERPKKFKAPVSGTFIPRVEYPLAADPTAEFSEYIFEDVETLYPIFDYSPSSDFAVEVIILHFGRIVSIDYIPKKNGNYNLIGRKQNGQQIEFPYLRITEEIPFVEITNGEVLYSSPE